MGDLLLGQADLADGSTGVADGEDRDSMALAARALGAASAMTDGALEEEPRRMLRAEGRRERRRSRCWVTLS